MSTNEPKDKSVEEDQEIEVVPVHSSKKDRSGMIVTVDKQEPEKSALSQGQQDYSENEDVINWAMNDFEDSTNRSLKREILDSINTIRFNCGMLVNNKKVQYLIVVLIGINAIMMGIATFDFVKDDERVLETFEIVDKAFLIIFTVELAMQLIYLGWRILLDGWLDFDLLIIITSWSFSSVQIVRAFRIFRALRLITRIKTMKNLLVALFGVMPRMAAIGVMLLLICFIFAVMMTQLFKELYDEGYTVFNYFGDMWLTLLTLFQMMTLDNWGGITREVMGRYSWGWVPIIGYVIVSGFVVVNLIIAVICDAISALGEDEKKKMEGNFDDDTDSDDNSQGLEIRAQLDSLEEQLEDLTRIQSRTFHMLKFITDQIEARRKEEDKKDI